MAKSAGNVLGIGRGLLAAVCIAASVPGTSAQAQAPGTERAPDAASRDQYPTFTFDLFGDVNWIAESTEPRKNTFRLGQLDFFLAAQLSDRVSLLSETVVELDDEGQFFVDIERLLLGYRVSEALRLTAGRYHTGIGFYNTTYHHGSYFEPSATRPLLFAFEDEGGPLPVHEVGVSLEGRLPSGRLGLQYLVEVGNGQRWTAEDPRPNPSAIDPNAGKSTNVGLFVEPDWWPGFRAGSSFYRDDIAGPDDASVSAQVWVASAALRRPRVEVMAEWVWMRHRQAPAPAVTNTAYYAQIVKRVRKAQLFARFEHTRLDSRTPLLGGLDAWVGPLVGVRFDPVAPLAIKVQYEWVNDRAPDPVQRVRVQAAVVF